MANQPLIPEAPTNKPAATASNAVIPPGEAPSGLDQVDWSSFGTATGLSLLVYLLTLAPNVTLGLSGLMSTGAMYAGVPHPPGYPVWTLYSWLWVTLLPFHNVAWRVAVGSAFAAAMTCGLVAMMVSNQGRILLNNAPARGMLNRGESTALRVVCGVVAGLVLGLSGAVWRKAVIADIWALSLLLFTLVVFFLWRWMNHPERRGHLYAAFLVFGLLLTSSQELIAAIPGLACFVMLGNQKLGRDASLVVLPLAVVLATRSQYGIWLDPYFMHLNGPLFAGFLAVGFLAGAIAWKTRGIGSEWKAALLCALWLLLGISFYFLVPVAAMTNPPVNHGYARTVEGLAHLLARGQYERVQPSADLASFLEQLRLYLRTTGREFGWVQLLVALVPFALLRRLDPRSRKWLLGVLALFMGAGPLLLAMLNPLSDVSAVILIKPYFAASYACLALCLGFGLLLVGAFTARLKKE